MADTAAAVPLSQVSYTELRHFASFSSSLCTLLNESTFQGAGYGGVTEVMKRRGSVENSEEFTDKQPSLRIWKKNILLIIDPFHYTVAKRSLGTGLTAAGVTSSWTWSTTLLSSVTVAYEYGVAGSFFYAACNSTQIMVFSNLAIVSLPSQ
jgi:hypothetical protein